MQQRDLPQIEVFGVRKYRLHTIQYQYPRLYS